MNVNHATQNSLIAPPPPPLCVHCASTKPRSVPTFQTNFSLIELGDTLLFTNRPAQAEPYYERALVIVDAADVNASYAMGKLGAARLRQGDAPGAETWLRQALSIQQGALGDEHVRTSFTRAQLGLSLLRQDRPQIARDLIEQALRVVREHSAEAGESERALPEGAHGEYLLASGRLGEAEPALLESYRIGAGQADQGSLIEALERLRPVYVAMERPAEAERYASLARDVLNSLKVLLAIGATAGPPLIKGDEAVSQ